MKRVVVLTPLSVMQRTMCETLTTPPPTMTDHTPACVMQITSMALVCKTGGIYTNSMYNHLCVVYCRVCIHHENCNDYCPHTTAHISAN